ncbi:MAG: sigF [Bacillales bacterium]|jgi:RNA polymerase sporulation-specific sigma factor|nr:sigF [Bacillales bacterium]
MEQETQSIQKPTLLKDEEVRELILQSQNGNFEARDEIVHKNTRLVWSVVQRFVNRGFELDDLYQIGCIGLIKSIQKFDLSFDVKFSTYAVPMIIGEIQRFIRDDGSVKVSRSLKELANKIRRTNDEFAKTFGRNPTISEISKRLGVPDEEIILALDASRTPSSIHETVYENDGDSIMLLDQIKDTSNARWFEKISLKTAIETLDEREKMIVLLRYFKDQTQSEVAERLGVSQVQISRLEKKILKIMKERME